MSALYGNDTLTQILPHCALLVSRAGHTRNTWAFWVVSGLAAKDFPRLHMLRPEPEAEEAGGELDIAVSTFRAMARELLLAAFADDLPHHR